jgi:hypothetical protein
MIRGLQDNFEGFPEIPGISKRALCDACYVGLVTKATTLSALFMIYTWHSNKYNITVVFFTFKTFSAMVLMKITTYLPIDPGIF